MGLREEAEDRHLLDLTLRPRGKERLEETGRPGSVDSQLQQNAHRCVGEELERPCGTWIPLVGWLSCKPRTIETQSPAISFIIFYFYILVVVVILMGFLRSLSV